MKLFKTVIAFLRENPLVVYMFVAIMMAFAVLVAAMVMTFR